MSVNGTETGESKAPQAPPVNGRSARVAADPKATPARGTTTRRRRDRQDEKAAGEERFFLAGANRNGDIPALGRECTSEAEAIINAFREQLSFYRVSEFQTRADVGPSGEPILRKDALKKSNPAS
jgi:hypothetical protein